MEEQNPYQELSRLLGASGSRILPQIIEKIAGPNEVRVLLAAFPAATVPELSIQTKIPPKEIQTMIPTLFHKGLLFLSRKEGEQRYYRVKSVPQFHDSSILWKGATRDFHDLWKKYMGTEWSQYGKMIEAFLPRPAVRIIPVGATIEAKAKVLAFEDVREIIKQAKNLAVTACTCRLIDGKCGKPLEACIQVNRAADYALERGTGRAITKEEALHILHQAEKEGLIHVVDNRQKVDHIICNCCSDCCMNWRLPNRHKIVDPSRFQATVNEEECMGCQACLDRCMFDAIRMEGDEPKARVSSERCVGCGVCTISCPAEAITMKEVRPPEVIPV